MKAKHTIIAATLAIAIVLYRVLPVGEWLLDVESWVGLNPVPGAIAYICLTVLATIALMPGWIPMMLAGLVFGMLPGLLLSMIGICAGAIAAMLAGRTLARTWVEGRIEGNARLAALDDALESDAFLIVVLTRLAIVIPFNVLNYAYGLTRVETRTYVAGTVVGMLPIVGLYVYLGTLARDIGQILSGEAQIGSGVWWIAAFALVMISIVILLIRRAMNRALERAADRRPA